MNYVPQLLFFFGAIGAFNAIILASYLLLHKAYGLVKNRLFSLFLLVLSLRVLKALFYAFSTEEKIWFLQSGPYFFLFIGPMLFSYAFSVLRPSSFLLKKWPYHLLFWLLIVFLLNILLPFNENTVLVKESLFTFIYAQWLVYILLSIFILANDINRNKVFAVESKWLTVLLGSNLIIWASFALIEFDYFVIGSIIFSLVFYIVFTYLLLNKKVKAKLFETRKVQLYRNSNDSAQQIIKQLESIMENEKSYTNPKLKVIDVAQKMGISSHELSSILNNQLNKNFTEFINLYRIEEVKQLIISNNHYTLEALGNQVGFHSKSAFYKAFKNSTGTTPSKYKKDFLSSHL